MNKYVINIENRSGSTQTYALFNEVPKVTGKVQDKIWSNIFKVAKGTPNKGSASFSIYKQYYAIAGSSDGTPAQGVTVNVTQNKDVSLGYSKPDGSTIPGTTLSVQVVDESISFNPKAQANTSFANCFEIQTKNDFTIAEAKQFNYQIGLGGSSTGASASGPSATFMPEPGVKYQIEPVNTYYITFGGYTQGTLINVQTIGDKCGVDFTEQPNVVNIVHTDHGELIIQSG